MNSLLSSRTLVLATICVSMLSFQACNSGGSSPTAPENPTIPTADGSSSGGSVEMFEYASIDVEKSTNGVDADNAPGPSIPTGTEVVWRYRVTNNGNETVTGISVVDSDADIGTIDCPSESLSFGESMECKPETGLAEEGQYSNTATVTATAEESEQPVSDTDDSHYLGVVGGTVIALDIDKKTNGEDADSAPGPIVLVGAPITWTYTVTNNSDLVASGITMIDDQEGPVGCDSSELGVGESMECGPVNGSAEAGQYANTATVEATIDGQSVTVTDDSHYFGSDPSVDIDKLTNGGDGLDLVIGCPVTWTYEVTNDGNIDLESVVVSDDVLGVITCPQSTLMVGESMTCEVTGTVEAGDYENTGSVTAEDIVGNPTGEATDASSYFGTSSCTEIAAQPDELWPPNHRLKTVDLVGDVCGGSATVTIVGVTQDEPVNGTGDGDTSPDAMFVDDDTVELRSERAGGGNGRVYGIAYEAVGGSVSCSGTAFVSVPHDQSGAPAVDDGQIYDSTDEL